MESELPAEELSEEETDSETANEKYETMTTLASRVFSQRTWT
jgi:hypothetical protein